MLVPTNVGKGSEEAGMEVLWLTMRPAGGNRTANTVTTRPAYVYVESGTYRVKSSIHMLVSTFLVGDPLNPPTLLADPELGNRSVIDGFDPYQGDIGSTKNFYMAVRNVRIDTTALDPEINATAMDWSVSQGCSLTNVQISMPQPSNHTGITMNSGGSGILISDSVSCAKSIGTRLRVLKFSNCFWETPLLTPADVPRGGVGIRLQGQQYLFKGLTFYGCDVCISVIGIHIATFQDISFMNCKYGVDMGSENAAGAVSLVDSSVLSCTAAVNAFVSGSGQGSLVIDRLQVSSANAVQSSNGTVLLAGPVPSNQVWVMGNE